MRAVQSKRQKQASLLHLLMKQRMMASSTCHAKPSHTAFHHLRIGIKPAAANPSSSGPGTTPASSPSAFSLAQLRLLALRNLAGLLPPSQCLEALYLYGEALENQERAADIAAPAGRPITSIGTKGNAAAGKCGGGDALLWGRRGGKTGLARYALEVGLARAPRHVPLLERAMEVCVCLCVCEPVCVCS